MWLITSSAVLGTGSLGAASQIAQTTVRIEVRAESAPVEGAIVSSGGRSSTTDAGGVVTWTMAPGPVQIGVVKEGFLPATVDVTVTGVHFPIVVDLTVQPGLEEEVIVVATTRTGRRLDDQPTRVEVLGREEIEEKMLMTPGDIVMMLNEMGGLRVQTTSPSLGAASVRVQGMKGRYTRFLSDGLPLFGQQVGGLGMLQIPPMDLGQVEVIKGTASALYGAGAMGGVVNLLTRRPGPEATREFLFNQSTLGATDAVSYLASPIGRGWSASLIGGGHWQIENDRDGDEWADLAGYARGVLRPRFSGTAERTVSVPDRRRHLRGPRRWDDARRSAGCDRSTVHRGAGNAPLRRRRNRSDAPRGSLCRDGACRGRVAAPRSSVW